MFLDEKAVKNCGGVVNNPSDRTALLPDGILSCNSNPFGYYLLICIYDMTQNTNAAYSKAT